MQIHHRVAAAVMAVALSSAALGDLTENTILQTNTALNLDTGAIVSTGGDLLWNGSTLAPQGTAKAASLGNLGGALAFNLLPPSYVMDTARAAKSTPLAASALVPGNAFVAVSNTGKIAKALVTANSGGSLSLLFVTYGASTAPGAPVITKILNNSSRIAPGFPNYGIAPSSLFVVTGSSLADPGSPVLQTSAAPGLPLTLNGASITVVVNGVTTHPALYYTSPAQLAAVLPAATPVGTGTLTVTYKGATSAPAPIQVVPSALGINIYNTNTGVATDAASGALLTFASSGSPGQTIVLWATGLGADPADSDTTFSASPQSVNTPLQIYVGGMQATILYQGSSGYPGVNQIDLTIPQGAPTGCWVSLAAITGTVVSNIVTLPINSGGGPCVDTQSGLNGNQISPAGGQTLRTGLVSISQGNSTSANGTRSTTASASAAFEKYTGLFVPPNSLSPGGCIVNDITPNIPGLTGLDVGAITLTGPGLPETPMKPQGIKGAFFLPLTTPIPASGGAFTFKGSGGADVGAFTSTITFGNPLLTWTNQSAATSIDRTQGLQLAWTGGTPGSYVFITGSSSGGVVLGGYTCLSPVEAGQFTVPSYILLALPPGTGGTIVGNNIYGTIPATGLDISLALGGVAFTATSTYK